MRSAPALAFDVRPSRRVAALAAMIVAAATIAPWLGDLGALASAAVSLASFVYGIVALRSFLRPRFRRVAWQASGWTLVDGNGREVSARLAAQAGIGPYLSLRWRLDPGGSARVLLGPDNLDADTLRRLILVLARGDVAHAA